MTRLFLFFVLVVSSCQRGDVNSAQALPSVILQGPWGVTQFSQDENDRLYLFGGYSFVFASGGKVTASKAGASAIGNWSSSSSSSGTSTLYLDFADTPSFEQLNENWEATEITQGSMKFRHVSSGGGGTDLLSLERR